MILIDVVCIGESAGHPQKYVGLTVSILFIGWLPVSPSISFHLSYHIFSKISYHILSIYLRIYQIIHLLICVFPIYCIYISVYIPWPVPILPIYLSYRFNQVQGLLHQRAQLHRIPSASSTATGSTGLTDTQLRNELHSHLKPLSSLFRVTDCSCFEVPVLSQTKSYAAIINIIRFCECDDTLIVLSVQSRDCMETVCQVRQEWRTSAWQMPEPEAVLASRGTANHHRIVPDIDYRWLQGNATFHCFTMIYSSH